MIGLILAASFASAPADSVFRDTYGVPHIASDTWGTAFRLAGYSVAEDRMWQMEQSRRVARGKMAEAFGPDFAASDREILKVGYTDEELQAQFDRLPGKIQEAFKSYAEGINHYLEVADGAHKLPEPYAANNLKPDPWTTLDSVAIAIRLFQQFGRGGAGEIRNLALFSYLSSFPGAKGHELDILDDFAWFNDPKATCTVLPSDDPLAKNPPRFELPDRKATIAHLAQLPKLTLFDLLPGVRLAERAESTRIAELVSAPYKMGSYCLVVSGTRSANGKAMLLSGPQMGFQNPSIVHEMSIRAPGISAVGMDVPGVPGVVIGHTDRIAWGLTSGVADTDDVFFAPTSGADKYKENGQEMVIESIKRTLKIKGKPDEEVEERRTSLGPVVLAPRSAPVVFSRRAAAWMRELDSMQALFGLYDAKSAAAASEAATKATVNFNVFAADVDGHISYRHAGLVPVRPAGVDPRFPAPADSGAWKGFLSPDQMPHVQDPKDGLIVNWNNKPVSWFPNGDTPVWGEIFRNRVLLDKLTAPKLKAEDLELAIWNAARTDYNYSAFAPFLKGVSPDLDAFSGMRLDGSRSAGLYTAFFDALREDLFLPTVGSLMSPDNFKLAVQPTIMLHALQGKTKFNFLGKRSASDLVKGALQRTEKKLFEASRDPASWRYAAPGIRITGQPPIPYSDRGTYIQIVELLATPSGRNVLPPGVAESGPHSQDQVPLSRAWVYKPMTWK